MNNINTWRQGHFVDQRQYDRMPQSWKEDREREERFLVRPGSTDNAICKCATPEDAKWVASRLNLTSDLELLTYNYATGKTDGKDLVKYVQDKLEKI